AQLAAAADRPDAAPLEGLRAHEAGQLIGLPVVVRQLSIRVGSLPRRGMKRVNLPSWPGLVTRMSSTMPAFSGRAKRGNESSAAPPGDGCLPAAAMRLCEVERIPVPRIRPVTSAETGADTVSSVSLTPFLVSRPAILTIGNGCIRARAWWRTRIVFVAVAVRPAASVTCNRTTWGPGVANVVVVVARPGRNGSVPVSAQAKPV